MGITKEAKLDVLTMAALRGILTPLPDDRDCQEQILSLMNNLGGIKLVHSASEIIDKALKHCDKDSKITHVVVNRLCEVNDIIITLLISDSEYPVNSEEDIVRPQGVFGYCYNASYPECSELGYSYYEKQDDGTTHRIG